MPNNGDTALIASLSGIRGVLNSDLTLADVSRFSRNFVLASGAMEVLVGRDTRRTGPAMAKAVVGTVASLGVGVVDYGVLSTPAMFRESRLRRRPAIMVTASHNEPEFNGLKFLVDGKGIGEEVFRAVVREGALPPKQFEPAPVRREGRPAYSDDVVALLGEGSCDGVRVAMDLGGGAATVHAPAIFRRLGCSVFPVNDAPGVFSRAVDPVADDLPVLRKLVKEEKCDIGLGFDCDGDRLVVVDPQGRKRTGDFMLTLAVSEMLSDDRKRVVVSLDTTRAIDDVVGRVGGEVFRSKVGEANVVARMEEKGADLGGEGSSGGLIDGRFNYCRDSMVAAVVIAGALKKRGRRVYDSVPSYHQARVALRISRAKARQAIKKLANKYDDPDQTDGVKITLEGRSWVLLRPSGTEDLVRVSAEAPAEVKARAIAGSFASKLREMSR